MELDNMERPARLTRIEELRKQIEDMKESHLNFINKFQKELNEKPKLEVRMSELAAKAKFHKNLVSKEDLVELQQKELLCRGLERVLEEKRRKLGEIKDSLQYYSFEPTNEDLKARIEELKSTRISLSDITFDESSPPKFGKFGP